MQLEEIRTRPLGMILGFSVPSIAAMVLTSLVTVADGFFIGNWIGEEGLAAVNLGLPVIYLFLAVGLMVSIGGAAMAGMALGAQDLERCNHVFRQTVATAAIFAALTAVAVWLVFEPMLDLLGAAGRTREYFRAYYAIRLPELVVMMVNSAMGMFVRGEGSPRYYLKVNALSTALNVALDALSVCVLKWGIEGIAAASLASALVSTLFLCRYFLRKARVYRFGGFRFSPEILGQSLFNGSSEMVGQLSIGIAMFAYNYVILRQAGVAGVTAFTVVGYTSYVFEMVVTGFGQGSSPLSSFTYGAGEYARARVIRRRTAGLAAGAGLAVLGLMALVSGWYGTLFVEDPAVVDMIRTGAVIFAVSFPCSGFNAITSFYFTSTGRAVESAVISLSRGLVVLLACIFLLPRLWGMTGIWLAAPVTEAVTLGVSLVCIRKDQTAVEISGKTVYTKGQKYEGGHDL